MLDILKQQYDYIRATREVLFSFLAEIPFEKLHTPVEHFGSGSIIETHLHVADCYRYWLGSFAFQERRADFVGVSDDDIRHAHVENVRTRFALVDEVVYRFLEVFDSRWFDSVTNEVGWQKEPWSTTPLWLLTHTETHEFHHKGQIVAMARHLGFVPPDTDLVVSWPNSNGDET